MTRPAAPGPATPQPLERLPLGLVASSRRRASPRRIAEGDITHESVRPRGSTSERADNVHADLNTPAFVWAPPPAGVRTRGGLLNGRFECRSASSGRRSSPGGCL